MDLSALLVPRLPEWVKSGDVKTDFKKIVKMPAMEERGYKRVFFIGLGAQKTLTEDRLRQVFAAIGKELASVKAASVAIWTAPFTNDKLHVKMLFLQQRKALDWARISLKDIVPIQMREMLHWKRDIFIFIR